MIRGLTHGDCPRRMVCGRVGVKVTNAAGVWGKKPETFERDEIGVGNYDLPLGYAKTVKHVITFFIIFIPKTSKPNLTSGGATLLSAELGVRVDYPNPLKIKKRRTWALRTNRNKFSGGLGQ